MLETQEIIIFIILGILVYIILGWWIGYRLFNGLYDHDTEMTIACCIFWVPLLILQVIFCLYKLIVASSVGLYYIFKDIEIHFDD